MAIISSYITMTMLSFLFLFFYFPVIVLSFRPLTTFEVPSGGSEAYAFDRDGGGPYTGVNDGRVVKYEERINGFVDFAYASPNRTKELCDGTNDPDLHTICGRTFGLEMYHRTNELYMMDTYYGLCVVGPEGGLAKQLATGSEGESFKFSNALDIDQLTGDIYFADSSSINNLKHVPGQAANLDTTARFLKYDYKTGKVAVLLKNLSLAGGVAISEDLSFVLVSEFMGNKIWKYWLKGPKANTSEILLDVQHPGNIKRAPSGDFWVAVNFQTPNPVPAGIKINENGTILDMVSIGTPFNGVEISEVYEFGGLLFVASPFASLGVVYKA
ncbi:unnamed protein product [Ilex paraguariensis]|uniref:Strictosidine synthase conserved region domain-containing protein n=1 Tax=Ilex paraguariensis TaxID=185542 RepID=A0ABC8TFP4_9AQUA